MTDPDLELRRGGGRFFVAYPVTFFPSAILSFFFLPNNVSLSLDPPLRFKLSIEIHKVSTAILSRTCHY